MATPSRVACPGDRDSGARVADILGVGNGRRRSTHFRKRVAAAPTATSKSTSATTVSHSAPRQRRERPTWRGERPRRPDPYTQYTPRPFAGL